MNFSKQFSLVRFGSSEVIYERGLRNWLMGGETYSGRGKFMPLPLKRKILETTGSLVTDELKYFHYGLNVEFAGLSHGTI